VGVLHIATPAEGNALGDPASISLWDKLDAQPALERLARIDAQGTAQPWLAESWEIGADGKTLTVKLKQGIQFHDGTEFNAEAVKWNWEHQKSTKSAYADTLA
jgi:peptide/nickel transport system substrate-binding protein